MRVTLLIDREDGQVQRYEATSRGKFALGLVAQVTQAAVAGNAEEARAIARMAQAMMPVWTVLKELLFPGETVTKEEKEEKEEKENR